MKDWYWIRTLALAFALSSCGPEDKGPDVSDPFPPIEPVATVQGLHRLRDGSLVVVVTSSEIGVR